MRVRLGAAAAAVGVVQTVGPTLELVPVLTPLLVLVLVLALTPLLVLAIRERCR